MKRLVKHGIAVIGIAVLAFWAFSCESLVSLGFPTFDYTPEYSLNQGAIAYEAKNYDQAIDWYNRVIRWHPSEYPDAYYWRGMAYFQKRDYENAIADFEAALRINPNHANAGNYLALVRQMQAQASSEGGSPATSAQAIPVQAELDISRLPDNPETDFRVEVTLDGSGLRILEYIGSVTTVKIPATIQGMPVRVIGGGAFTYKGITRVVIPEGITTIEDGYYGPYDSYAHGSFSENPLIYVSLPSTLRSIGAYAFSNDGIRITSNFTITIPNSVTSIGNNAFSSSGLTSITLPENLTSIRSGTFAVCEALTSITIPNRVTSIEGGAFSRSGLTSITLPESLTTIGYGAFSYCTALTSITIPNRVTSIGEEVFRESGLTSIIWPSQLTTIPRGGNYSGMFRDCVRLQSVVISEGVTTIGNNAFSGCTALTSVTLPSTIRTIEWGAFSGCSSLTTINIPDSVRQIQIDSGAFGGNTRMSLATQAAWRRLGYTGSF